MPPRLLLVDDEPRNLTLLEALLAPLGMPTSRANSGREALEAFQQLKPDLILLDVMMPDLDGIDVLTHIRAHELGTHLPVILVTGQHDREDRLRGFEAGADDFLEKPVDRALLLTRVRTLLRLKEARDEISRRNVELLRLQQEQREMTELIVHDLRNPLSIMHLNIDWVRQSVGGKEPELDEALRDALDASARVQKMLDDLLAVARIEHADAPLLRTRIDLGELLGDVARAHTRAAQEVEVTLGVQVERGLSVDANPEILQRILENLVRNALRFTPPGGRIGLSARAGAEIEIAVSNTGAPIPAQERTRIFEKFRRGDSAPASRRNVGLGLYFCQRAMEAHGGSVTVAETPEWPTSFVLRFPTVSG